MTGNCLIAAAKKMSIWKTEKSTAGETQPEVIHLPGRKLDAYFRRPGSNSDNERFSVSRTHQKKLERLTPEIELTV